MFLVVAVFDAEGDPGAEPSNSGEPANDEHHPEPSASFGSAFLLDHSWPGIVAIGASDGDGTDWPHSWKIGLVLVANDDDGRGLWLGHT